MVNLDLQRRSLLAPAGSLYGEYRTITHTPVVDRAYRNYMQKMVKLGLIKTEGKGRWSA